ncbi:putative GEM-like protein [Helianthus debilis subsp. tardiflorus]
MNPHQPPPPPPYPSSSSSSDPSLGTHVMGTPVPPGQSNPYVQYGAPQPPPPPPPPHQPRPTNVNMDNVRKKLNTWGNKAETAASNIWTNRKSLFLTCICICMYKGLFLYPIRLYSGSKKRTIS